MTISEGNYEIDLPEPALPATGGNVVVLADFVKVPVLDEDHVGIDDLIDELCDEDPTFTAELANAGKWAAETLYPGEVSLKTLRLNAGLSQREVATRIGSSQSHVWRLENGDEDMRKLTVVKLAEVLGIDPVELFRIIIQSPSNQ